MQWRHLTARLSAYTRRPFGSDQCRKNYVSRDRKIANQRRSYQRQKVVLSTLALALMVPVSAFSQSPAPVVRKHSLEFLRVADTTQGFSSFRDFPAINNHGEVAFVAVPANGREGVFRSRAEGAAQTTIASEMDGLDLFGNEVSINADGVVAFSARTATGDKRREHEPEEHPREERHRKTAL